METLSYFLACIFKFAILHCDMQVMEQFGETSMQQESSAEATSQPKSLVDVNDEE
jgi:hypothetical protein